MYTEWVRRISNPSDSISQDIPQRDHMHAEAGSAAAETKQKQLLPIQESSNHSQALHILTKLLWQLRLMIMINLT